MIAIVGGGPAGLAAAEVIAASGREVTVFDARASVGRKFLVAGSGGLNITKEESLEKFVSHYQGPGMPEDLWPKLLEEFGVADLRAWVEGLGIATFVASTGRVYPEEMKAAPLLRRWVQRLRHLGVRFALHHRLETLSPPRLAFRTPEGTSEVQADAVVLALGGGSWPQTGSDGSWVEVLRTAGVDVAELAPANCGWEVDWPPALLTEVEGLPIKNVTVSANGVTAAGELLVTRYGLEGGALYQLGGVLREMAQPALTIDFKPALTEERIRQKLGPARRNLVTEAQTRLKLSPAAAALLRHHPQVANWTGATDMARAVKSCPITLRGPRPLAEAISSAGGVRWSEVMDNLMLRRWPGVFVAGEMLDWEAPTGGYLMQGAFASGRKAAQSAIGWLEKVSSAGHPDVDKT